MALPTLAQLKALADTWWSETPPPAVPHLDVLAARVASLFGQPNAACRLTIINNVGVYTLVAELEVFGSGMTTRQWTPSAARAQQDLGDVYDPARGRSPRQDGI
jgi:hypothetical protein